MKIFYTKKEGKYDELRCLREDNSEHRVLMPKIGSLPHDLVHFVVEKELGMTDGFYGHVARGEIDGFYLQEEKDGKLSEKTVNAQQAESIVECFQAEAVSGEQSTSDFQYFLQVTCEARKIPTLEVTEEELKRIRKGIFEMNERWENIKIGETLELEF